MKVKTSLVLVALVSAISACRLDPITERKPATVAPSPTPHDKASEHGHAEAKTSDLDQQVDGLLAQTIVCPVHHFVQSKRRFGVDVFHHARQLETRAVEFVDVALTKVIDQLADVFCNPRRAEEASAIRSARR